MKRPGMPPRTTPLARGPGPERRTRIKARNAKRKGSRFPMHRQPLYREWILALSCLLMGHPRHTCRGRLDPAHVIPQGRGTDDVGNLVPACRRLHDEQEGRTAKLEARCGVSLTWCAYRLTRLWRAGVTPDEIRGSCESAGLTLAAWLETSTCERLLTDGPLSAGDGERDGR